jgi:predicted O-linked N-acetylglucosamine transferase (SPINDLY family)
MGVPVITLVGKTAMGRAGASQLSNLGLTDLIARSADQYVEIVVKLAADRARLSALRASLRPRMEQSPLMDGDRFAGDVESVYRTIWRSWCQSRKSGQ